MEQPDPLSSKQNVCVTSTSSRYAALNLTDVRVDESNSLKYLWYK